MIAWHLILEAGAITAAAVAVTAVLSRWPAPQLLAAVVGAFLLILGWRAIANGVRWNDDFVPMVSVGDIGCLLAGAAAPALVARVPRRVPRGLGPVLAGGLVGLAVNVVIL